MTIYISKTYTRKWSWQAVENGKTIARSPAMNYDSKEDCITNFGVFTHLIYTGKYSLDGYEDQIVESK